MVAERMERLRALASNLWWSWDAEATALFASIDPFRWKKYGHNPVALLQDVEPDHLQQVLAGAIGQRVDIVWGRFREYLEAESWCSRAAPKVADQGVAYFSME